MPTMDLYKLHSVSIKPIEKTFFTTDTVIIKQSSIINEIKVLNPVSFFIDSE